MSPMHRQPPRRALLIALLAAIACADDTRPPTDPGFDGDPGFYPLAVGTRRDYQRTRTVRFLAEDGGDARPPLEETGVATRTIVAREKTAGAVWSVEEENLYAAGGTDTVTAWRRYREDESGLYRADLPLSLPPGGAAAEDTVTEARRFAYPRAVGATWALREGDPDATATLEMLDTLATALGAVESFVVSYVLPGMGPDDFRRFWYSTCGVLRSDVHAEFDAVDAGSGERVHVVSHQTEEIVAAHPPCAIAAQNHPARPKVGARPAPLHR